MLTSISLLIGLGCLLMHFYFAETRLEEEEEAAEKPLWKIYSMYKVFLWPSYRYFRTFWFMSLYYQGFNFFLAGYNYEMIGKGFSRDLLNTIDNCNIVFQLLLVYFFGKYANHWGFARSLQLNFAMILMVLLPLWIWFPVSVLPVSATSFLMGVLSQWEFLIAVSINAHFPEMGITGMIYTGNASGFNLGRMVSLHTALLQHKSWRFWAALGMGLQVLIILSIPWFIDKIEDGETAIQDLEEAEQSQL